MTTGNRTAIVEKLHANYKSAYSRYRNSCHWLNMCHVNDYSAEETARAEAAVESDHAMVTSIKAALQAMENAQFWARRSGGAA